MTISVNFVSINLIVEVFLMRYVKVLFPTLLIIITSILLTSCGTFLDYREDEYKEFKEKKIPLMIKTNEIASVNSVGGVDVSINAKNLSNKTIKYVRYTVKPYNGVGDAVKGSIRRRSTTTIGGTGPIKPMESALYRWENVWYNGTISCMVITGVHITYLDGSRKTYSGANRVAKLISSIGDYGSKKDPKNSCKYEG